MAFGLPAKTGGWSLAYPLGRSAAQPRATRSSMPPSSYGHSATRVIDAYGSPCWLTKPQRRPCPRRRERARRRPRRGWTTSIWERSYRANRRQPSLPGRVGTVASTRTPGVAGRSTGRKRGGGATMKDYAAVVERESDGRYSVYVPDLPGLARWGTRDVRRSPMYVRRSPATSRGTISWAPFPDAVRR